MLKNTVTTLTMLSAACAAVAAISVAQPVFAQTQAPAASPAPAEAAANRSPELSLQATASSEVKQDTVRIALAAEVEGADQPATGKKLSALLDDVVKRARDTKGVEVRTGNYNVWPNTGSKGKIAGWRGQGEVILESKDFEAAAALASKLSDKTAISSISFVVALRARPRSASCSRKRRKPSRTGRWPPPTLLDFRATA